MKRVVIKDIKGFSEIKEVNWKCIALDTETTALEYDKLEIVGVSICDGETVAYIDLQDNPEKEELLAILKDKLFHCKFLICHNIPFDLKVLLKYNLLKHKPTLYDTMVADHLINENRSHALKSLAKDLLGYDTVQYEDAAEDVHSQKFYDYALNDALWTWELADRQRHELDERSKDLFTRIEMPFQWILVEMERTGFLIDTEKVQKIIVELQELIETTEIEMHDMLGLKYDIQMCLDNSMRIHTNHNFNSTHQLATIIFDTLGLEVIETTATGLRQTGKKTLEALRSKHKFVPLLEKYKISQKLLNAFFAPLPGFLGKDNRVRPNFRDIGTKTGRLSCTKPNLQQLSNPKKGFPDLRSCFIAPAGHKLIACDYSGQELRVLTQITQEPVLIDTFNKGKDMHLSTANDFFELGIPEEGLYESNKEHDTYKKQFKPERNKAKIINFGMAYGKGAFGFSKDFNISEEEAQVILDKYFAALPKVKQAIDDCHRDVKRHGKVQSLAGRTRHFEKNENGYYDRVCYRQSFNFLIQGFSADMIRKAMVMVSSNREEVWGLKTVATVHDEAVYQVREEYADVAAKYIKNQFEQAVNFCIPVVADVSIGDTYSEIK